MYPNLNAELARNNKTQIDISLALNISSSTTSEKMNGKKDFKLKECKKIIEYVLPGNTIDYLFDNNIQNQEELTEKEGG